MATISDGHSDTEASPRGSAFTGPANPLPQQGMSRKHAGGPAGEPNSCYSRPVHRLVGGRRQQTRCQSRHLRIGSTRTLIRKNPTEPRSAGTACVARRRGDRTHRDLRHGPAVASPAAAGTPGPGTNPSQFQGVNWADRATTTRARRSSWPGSQLRQLRAVGQGEPINAGVPRATSAPTPSGCPSTPTPSTAPGGTPIAAPSTPPRPWLQGDPVLLGGDGRPEAATSRHRRLQAHVEHRGQAPTSTTSACTSSR